MPGYVGHWLVGDVVCVRYVQEEHISPHFHGIDPIVYVFYNCPRLFGILSVSLLFSLELCRRTVVRSSIYMGHAVLSEMLTDMLTPRRHTIAHGPVHKA